MLFLLPARKCKQERETISVLSGGLEGRTEIKTRSQLVTPTGKKGKTNMKS